MNSLKKLLQISVALGAFFTAAYNLVWSPDWQVKRWPETGLRAAYINTIARAAIDFSGAEREAATINYLQTLDPELESKVFNRVLGSLAITVIFTAGFALLPVFAGRGREGRIRGAQLATVRELRCAIWRREHAESVFAWSKLKETRMIGSVYAATGAIGSGLLFRNGNMMAIGAVCGVVLFALAELCKKTPEPLHVHIGGVPLPLKEEGRHTCIFGTTGSGKSMAIYGLVFDARHRGDRGIVADIGGATMQRFLRKGDIVLAPGQQGATAKWSPFAEIRHANDFAQFAASAIPDSTGEIQNFSDMGRVLLSEVMRSLYNSGEHSISRLLHYCCVATRDELAPIVANTPAAVYTAHDADRLLVSVRSVVSTALAGWQVLDEEGDFSVRDWVRSAPRGQWLFLRYTDGNSDVMKQMLAAWLKIAISETISDDINRPPATWFVADEFSGLGQLPSAAQAVAKLRRYNGKILWGVHSVAQLWSTYGRDVATSLLSCLNTKLYLAAGDPETAEWCSKAIGDQERVRQEVSRSRRGVFGLGGDPSTSEADRRAIDRLVLPSELETLPELRGYLKIAGKYPVAPVRIAIPPTETRI